MPKANYNIVCRVPGENIMYVSGHLPIEVSACKMIFCACCVRESNKSQKKGEIIRKGKER